MYMFSTPYLISLIGIVPHMFMNHSLRIILPTVITWLCGGKKGWYKGRKLLGVSTVLLRELCTLHLSPVCGSRAGSIVFRKYYVKGLIQYLF